MRPGGMAASIFEMAAAWLSASARVVDNVVVLYGKIFRHGPGDQRFDLADHDSLDAGMVDEASCGHAGAQSDDQYRARTRMQQPRQMAEHPLQAHVSRRGGRFILAADVKVPYSDRRFRHGDGCVHSFGRVEDTGSWFDRFHARKRPYAMKPLTLYQELLNDLYFHVLAKVDEYNTLAGDARKVYVGVKGPFNVGSPLVPADLAKLPLRKYVPATWWDTIYFDGYNMGYEDGYQNQKPQEPAR